MSRKPKDLQTQQDAFDLFCMRKPLLDIAKQLGITMSRVRKWSSQGKWMQKREEFWIEKHEARRELAKKFEANLFNTIHVKSKDILTKLLEGNTIAVDLILGEGRRIVEENNQDMKRLKTYCELLQIAAQVFKTSLPNISDEIGLSILQDYKKIQEALKKEGAEEKEIVPEIDIEAGIETNLGGE